MGGGGEEGRGQYVTTGVCVAALQSNRETEPQQPDRFAAAAAAETAARRARAWRQQRLSGVSALQ